MSRIGRLPITIPQGVKVIPGDCTVRVEGPLGKLECRHSRDIKVNTEGGRVVVSLVTASPQGQANFGTTRAHINNLIQGVTKGFKRSLELVGVGFTAKVQGPKLVLAVGFSHDVELEIPKGVKCTVNKTIVDLESPDREQLGTFASRIRKVQPPEPYLGKGIKYTTETVRRKAGKAGKK